MGKSFSIAPSLVQMSCCVSGILTQSNLVFKGQFFRVWKEYGENLKGMDIFIILGMKSKKRPEKIQAFRKKKFN
jgi:hypothetical protein